MPALRRVVVWAISERDLIALVEEGSGRGLPFGVDILWFGGGECKSNRENKRRSWGFICEM
jgi:hypothetical protein